MHARAPAGPPACVHSAPRLSTALQVRRGRAVVDRQLERRRRSERQCSHFSAQSSGRSSGGSGNLQDAALRFGRSAGKRCAVRRSVTCSKFAELELCLMAVQSLFS